jgi:ABC-type nitrate/sulfonate/bicarbonate transport system substrate-binding protein
MQLTVFRTIRAATVALSATIAFVAGTTAAAAPDNPTLVIGVPGLPPDFLAVRSYVALDRGLYARYVGHTTQVSLQPFASDGAEIEALENGQIPLAWASTPEVLAEAARGEPLVAIEGMDVPDWEIGSTDPTITTCSQLSGQTIGVDEVGGSRYDALVAMLATCGLTIQNVKTVEFPGEAGMNAQIAGEVSLNVEHYDEAAQVGAMGKSVTVVERLADADPNEHFEMLVTTKAELASHRALFVKLLEGDIAATRWLAKPANLAAATAIGQITGETAAVVGASISHDVATGWWNVGTPGLSPQRIGGTLALYLKLGVIPPTGKKLTWSDVADPSVWRSAERALSHP